MDERFLPKINNQKIEEMRRNSLQKIKSDEEIGIFINELGFDDAFVMRFASKFLQYIEDRKICSNCPGYEKCKKMLKHISLDLYYDEDARIIDNKFVNCKAAKKIVECEKHFTKMDFDESWLNSSIKEALNISPKEREKTIKALVKIIKTIKAGEVINKGIYLNGEKSLGKSYILATFATNLINSGYQGKIAYINTPKEFRILQDLQFDSKEALNQEMQLLINADILILDDFGNEYKTDYLRDMIVLPILSERYSRQKLTLFTSNYSLNEIQDMYSTSRANGPKAKHLVNIISSLADEFTLNGLPVRF